MPNEGIQGDKRGTYFAPRVRYGGNEGSPTRRESYGHGAAVGLGGRESRRHEGSGGRCTVQPGAIPAPLREDCQERLGHNPDSTRGAERKADPAYRRLTSRIHKAKATGRREDARHLRKLARAIPSQVTDDLGYRRLRYGRYADDFLRGFAGPRSEAAGPA